MAKIHIWRQYPLTWCGRKVHVQHNPKRRPIRYCIKCLEECGKVAVVDVSK